MQTSSMPAATNGSASLGLAQMIPWAPAATCRRAMSGILWVLTCGRNLTWLRSMSACQPAMLRSSRSRSHRIDGVSRSPTASPATGPGCASGLAGNVANVDLLAEVAGVPGCLRPRVRTCRYPARRRSGGEGADMRYQSVAEAYRDLEGASARLELIDRLARLFTETPTELLPTVALLCQGQIAPDFAGVELGLAERLAARAVAQAAGVPAEQVLATARDTGDLGLAAERLLASQAGARTPTLEVERVFEGLHQIAEAQGTGSQARKLEGLVALLDQATPLEARYLLRTVTATLRLGIGTATILDALAEVHAGGRNQRLILERAYNICSDLGLVAATLATKGLAAVEQMQVRAGNPVRPMLAQRMSEPAEILAKLGGACAAEYKYDGIRVQAHRTGDGALELYTRRLERVSTQFPEVVAMLAEGLGPREAILEGEVVAFDPASGELRPFQDVMFRRRKYGISDAVRDFPVSMFCFELLYADGTDLTGLPYLERRARLAEAVTPSARLRLATAEQVQDEPALEATASWGSFRVAGQSTWSSLPQVRPAVTADREFAGHPPAGRRPRPGRP